MKGQKPGFLSNPVKQISIVNRVIERIKEALIKKELNPGDYLPTETELTAKLGVSKTSVREAIKMLQALGVVEVRRGRGTKIRDRFEGNIIDPLIFQLIMASGQTQDIIDFRIMFEPAYTLMAMSRADQNDIDRIAATIAELENAIQSNQQTAGEDLAFHLQILRSTHNPLVIRVGETIIELFKESIGYTVKHHPEIVLRDHKRIFAAFCQKHENKLRKAILQSFEGWRLGLDFENKPAKRSRR
jgi:GntR family transcriptional repressor for pyruvate dehydrogenase complex